MNPKFKLSLAKSLHYCPAIAVALGLSCVTSFAAGTANDTASNYAPSSWSASPANLGSGFGAWSITLSNAFSPPYVGTFLDTGSAVVSGGYSWGTYANGTDGSGNTGAISVNRAFTAGASGSSSLFNQTFSVDLSSAGVGPGQGDLSVGIGTAFLFDYNGAGIDNFTLSVDGGSPATASVNFSQLGAGINIALDVNGALNSSSENYTFTVTAVSDNSLLYNTSGTFDSSAYNTSYFSYLDSNTTGNGFFNNLNITTEAVPEPSTIALAGMGGLALLFAIRRRK